MAAKILRLPLNDAVTVPRRPDAEVIAEFDEMQAAAHRNGWAEKMKCFGKPELYSDYKTSPTQDVAAALCAGCPTLTLCREYAVATRRHWTVLGGVAWVDGHPFEPTTSKVVTKPELLAA